MSPFLLFNSIVVLIAFNQLPISYSLQQQQQSVLLPNQCDDRCGHLQVPFPFHLNTSCGSDSDAFRLSCFNSTTLFLTIGSQAYRLFEFFSDGVLIDFPGTISCRQYYDVNSFGFNSNGYFGISVDNVIGLYDCEDSSLCKADCEKVVVPGCDGNGASFSSCCYPLSDFSVWRVGDGFSVFSEFGCRGFSSWVVPPGASSGKRGVKLEWAVPRNSSKGVCASNAYIVNATTIRAGTRCVCQNGFIGDGYADGIGCLKSCIKDGRETYGKECYTKRHTKKKVVILAGVLSSAFIVASLVALCYLLRQPIKPSIRDPDQAHIQSTISFRKACKTRLFTYCELEEATKGFEDVQKLADDINGTVHAGVLSDGSYVAVHKVQCESERDLMRVLSRVEILSTILHKNVARLVGCCIDSGYTPLVVYEFSANGTLEDHLHQGEGQKVGLDWYKRLNIAAETASALAYLQYEISPPIYHHQLKSSSIFIDQEYSVKISGFGLLNPGLEDGSRSYQNSEGEHFYRSDVYDLGMVLLEIIAGSRNIDLPTVTLSKIRSGMLEEIVDPLLYYHEQPSFRREQIGIVADLVTRCLLFGGDGRLGMMDVARELIQIMKESMNGGSKRGPALEETFSNSSLLQMISMSPDSIYVP